MANNIALLSIATKLDEKSTKEVIDKYKKTVEQLDDELSNINFDEVLVEKLKEVEKTLNKKIFNNANLSSFYKNLFSGLLDNIDDVEKMTDVTEEFAHKIEMLAQAGKGSNGELFSTIDPKSYNKIISQQEKILEKEKKVAEKREALEAESEKIAKQSRKVSTIENSYGEQDYSKLLASLKQSLSTEKDFTDEQQQAIENLAKMVSLYQAMENSSPEEGTKEAIKYSKDLLKVVEEITKAQNEVDSFTNGGASKYVSNKIPTAKDVNAYSLINAQNSYVEKGLTKLQGNVLNEQSKLLEILKEAISSRAESFAETASENLDKIDKRLDQIKGNAKSFETSDDAIIDDEEVENANLMDKALELIKDDFKDVQKYAVDAETALSKVNEIIEAFNNEELKSANDLNELFAYVRRLEELDAGGMSDGFKLSDETKSLIQNLRSNETYIDDEEDAKINSIEDRIEAMTDEQLDVLDRLENGLMEVEQFEAKTSDEIEADIEDVEETAEEDLMDYNEYYEQIMNNIRDITKMTLDEIREEWDFYLDGVAGVPEGEHFKHEDVLNKFKQELSSRGINDFFEESESENSNDFSEVNDIIEQSANDTADKLNKESEAFEEVDNKSKDAAESQDIFATANENVETKANEVKESLEEESKAFEEVGNRAKEASEQINNPIETNLSSDNPIEDVFQGEDTSDVSEQQEAVREELSKTEQQAKETEEAIHEATFASTTNAENSSSASEAKSVQDVEGAVTSLTTAIGETKVSAIDKEAKAMKTASESEIANIGLIETAIDNLIEKLKAKNDLINNSNSNKPNNDVKEDTTTVSDETLNSLKKLIKTLNSVDDKEGLTAPIGKIRDALKDINNYTDVPSIFAGIKITGNQASNIQTLGDSLEAINTKLKAIDESNNGEGSQFLAEISKLTEKAEALKDLANIVKESKAKIKSVTDATDNTSVQTKKVEKESDAYKELLNLIERYRKASITYAASGKKDDNATTAISDIKDKIDKLRGSLGQGLSLFSNEELSESQRKIDNIEEEIIKVKQEQSKDFFKGLDGSVAKFQESLDKLKIKPDDTHSYQGWLDQITDLTTKINEYENALEAVKNLDIIPTDAQEEINGLNEGITKLITKMKNTNFSDRGYTDVSLANTAEKINKLLKQNSAMSKEAKAQIQAYYNELRTGNPSKPLGQIVAEVEKIIQAERLAGREGKSFLSIIKDKAIYGFAAQIGMYFGFNDIIRYAKEAVSSIIDLDTALIDLKKTTSMTSSELEDFYYSANDVAKQMGVTTEEIIEQAAAWSRLGYSSNEAATEMATLSSQFASISPGMDTETAQEGLVSIMKAWDISYEDVKSEIMDNINTLGNSFAETNEDIIEGMERSASALSAVGTSYQDAFALFTGAQEILQSSEVAGRALRSISLRVRGYSESSEDGLLEADDELTTITGDLIDLTKTAEHTQGVSIFKDGSTTEFKSLVEYFGEINSIWDEMTEKQQNDYLQKAFGKTQAQAGSALITNYQSIKDSLEAMENSAGSADREMATIEQSIEYKLNALKETWVGTFQDIINRKDIGTAVDLLTKLSEAIGWVLDKIGLLGTIGLGAGAFASLNNVGNTKCGVHKFEICLQ